MPKLAFRKEYEGKFVEFSNIRGIITLNDRVTQDELQLLLKMKHPAVFVLQEPKEVKKPLKDKE